MKRALLIGLAVCALVIAAVIALLAAEGLLFDSKPRFSPEWAECDDDDICVAVALPCGWTAVNLSDREAAEAYYGYLATVIELRCRADEVPAEPPPAACRAGRCVLD
ncbi:MAG: hypothetical protein JSU82_04065 [Rhodospirillales bacterium]|nr:MAG: hypothetical protein JSU82_04065 [Rhodospirillales bacterium]